MRRSTTSSYGPLRLRNGLVSEVTLVCVLLISAELMLRSFRESAEVGAGFSPGAATDSKRIAPEAHGRMALGRGDIE